MDILNEIDAVLAAQPDLFEGLAESLFGPDDGEPPKAWSKVASTNACDCDNDTRLVFDWDGIEPLNEYELSPMDGYPTCILTDEKVGDGFRAFDEHALSEAYLTGLGGQEMSHDLLMHATYTAEPVHKAWRMGLGHAHLITWEK